MKTVQVFAAKKCTHNIKRWESRGPGADTARVSATPAVVTLYRQGFRSDHRPHGLVHRVQYLARLNRLYGSILFPS